jgi:hypothetical protein
MHLCRAHPLDGVEIGPAAAGDDLSSDAAHGSR